MNNMTETLNIKKSVALILTDLMAIFLILVVPAASHLLPFPVYYLDPMRLVLFAAYFVNRNEWNAYVLAISLPIFSMLYSGHPIPVKAVLISFELLLNMILLTTLVKKGSNIFLAVFASILFSKVAYYIVKFVLIKSSILPGNLFSTNLLTQLIIALGLSGLFYVFLRNKINAGK